MTYTPIRALQYYDEKFDVVLAGAIIEHLADSVSTIGAICRMAKEAVIIAFTPVEIDQAQFMRTMETLGRTPRSTTSWWVLSEGLYRRVFANLGFEIELSTSRKQLTLLTWARLTKSSVTLSSREGLFR